MPITDPLVLPVDVVLTPVRELPGEVQRAIGAGGQEVAVTRPRGRAPTKLVTLEGMELLEEFRTPSTVVDAIVRLARRRALDADALLVESFPLLRDCLNSHLLVPASSPWAAAILPLVDQGERLGEWEVIRTLRVLEDTELHCGRHSAGALAALKLCRVAGPKPASSLAHEAAALERAPRGIVPRVLGHGRLEDRDWLALEWCEGVPPTGALALAADDPGRHRLAVALVRAYAGLHAAGLLHGDVHPGNVLVGRDGTVRLLDFGLARALTGPPLPGPEGAGGVTRYESPERAEALRRRGPLPLPTLASEQFSLTAMVYELLAGRTWFTPSLGRDEVLDRIVSEHPAPFTAAGRPPWPGVEEALRRGLAREPGARWPDVRALADALARAAPAAPAPAAPRRSALAAVEARFLRDTASDARRLVGVPGAPPWNSIMHGRVGIAWALWRLACRRDDPDLLTRSRQWMERAEGDIEATEAFLMPDGDLTAEVVGAPSLWHGVAGQAFVSALVAATCGDTRTWRTAIGEFCRHASAPWARLDLTPGLAGTLLAAAGLQEAGRNLSPAPTRTLVEQTGEALRLRLPPDAFDPAIQPTAAHGAAGICQALLRWQEAGGHATAGLGDLLDRLATSAVPEGRGLAWPVPRPGGDGVALPVIAGWCNGPTGMVPVWTAAHRVLGHPRALELAEGAAWSAWESSSRMPDLCCGLTGRAWALLAWHRVTGEAAWLERAGRLAEAAAERMEGGRGDTQHPLSLYKGIGGLAVLAADLDHPAEAAMPLVDPEGWPHDSPEDHG